MGAPQPPAVAKPNTRPPAHLLPLRLPQAAPRLLPGRLRPLQLRQRSIPLSGHGAQVPLKLSDDLR